MGQAYTYIVFMVGPGLSTNEKIQAILDDAVRATIPPPPAHDTKTKRLRRRLKLYCVGSGATLPKVSESRGQRQLQQRPSTCSTFPHYNMVFHDTVPSYSSRPCDDAPTYEHDAMYRTSQDGLIGTAETRHRAGIGAARREPWYCGVARSGAATTCAMADAVRYGFRGVASERKYRQFRGALRSSNVETTPPEVVHKRALFKDEWTPPLKGHVVTPGGAALPTPRLWPENSCYVSGFRTSYSRQRPTSSWYATQTTVQDTADIPLDQERPEQLPARLRRVRFLDSQEDCMLRHAIQAERQAKQLSETRQASSLESGSSLSSVDDHRVYVKYAGPHTLLIANGPKRPRSIVSTDLYQFELKWHQIAAVYKTLNKSAKTHVFELADAFKERRDESGSVSRHDFVTVIGTKLDSCSPARAHLLFSLFDDLECDGIFYVDVLACLLALAGRDDPPKHVLLDLWRMHREHGPTQRSVIAMLEAAFLCCAQSAQQVIDMRRHHIPTLHSALTKAVLLRPSSDRPDLEPPPDNGIFSLEPICDQDLEKALDEAPQALDAFDTMLRATKSVLSLSPDAKVATKLEQKINDKLRRNVTMRATVIKDRIDRIPIKCRHTALLESRFRP